MSDFPLQDALAGTNSIPGLLGAAIVKAGGELLACRLSPPYEPVLLHGALAQVAAMHDVLASLEPSPQMRTFFARFDDVVIVVRVTERYSAVVMATSVANPAMLAVAVNSMQTKAEASFSRPAGSAGRVQTSDLPVFRTNSGGGQDRPAPPAEGLSGIQWKTATGLKPKPPEDANNCVSLDSLRAVVKILAKYIGPMAQTLVKQEIANQSATPTTLGKERYPGFIQNIAASIKSASDRETFVQEALRAQG